jgi:hypothetical protein
MPPSRRSSPETLAPISRTDAYRLTLSRRPSAQETQHYLFVGGRRTVRSGTSGSGGLINAPAALATPRRRDDDLPDRDRQRVCLLPGRSSLVPGWPTHRLRAASPESCVHPGASDSRRSFWPTHTLRARSAGNAPVIIWTAPVARHPACGGMPRQAGTHAPPVHAWLRQDSRVGADL